MRDLYSNLAGVASIAPGVATASIDGAAVDVSGASGALALVHTGAVSGAGDFGVKLQESPDGVTWADVAAVRVKSNAPATLAANSVYRMGYLGKMPKLRAVLVKAGGTSLAVAVTIALRPLDRPVA